MNDPVFFEAAQGARLPHHARDQAAGASATVSITPTPSRSAASPRRARPSAWASISTRPAATSQPNPQTVAALFPNQLEGVPQAEAAAWVELSRVLLNLDEFITRD